VRVIIYGAGGVGGVIGAQLFKAARDVVLIARGEHLEAIRTDGLRYQTPAGDEQLMIPAVAHPDELTLSDQDIVLMTMKSQHTLAALDALRARHSDAVRIVCCQNGVANERAALRRFARVYAMLVYLPAQLTEPGRVQCHAALKSGVLDVGLYPGGTDETCEVVANLLNAVNFSVYPDPSVMRLKYAKLLTNLNNSLEAVAPDGADAKPILEQMKAEGRACFDAAGIAYASEAEAKERRRGVMATGDIPGVARVGGSSKQSLMRGTGDIEADYLNGEIVQLGRLHGIATPANAVLQRLAVKMATQKSPPAAMALEEVQNLIERERH
jgi:2-dehydropantoate 2-reductase